MSKLLAFMVITVMWLGYAAAVSFFVLAVLDIQPDGHTNQHVAAGFTIIGCAIAAVVGLFITDAIWTEAKK